eukprot:1676491-Pleurochrysis_carterae.AAC.1
MPYCTTDWVISLRHSTKGAIPPLIQNTRHTAEGQTIRAAAKCPLFRVLGVTSHIRFRPTVVLYLTRALILP